jgi:hypothetical protein
MARIVRGRRLDGQALRLLPGAVQAFHLVEREWARANWSHPGRR